eukprot:2601039-Rhodomonas_salina.5
MCVRGVLCARTLLPSQAALSQQPPVPPDRLDPASNTEGRRLLCALKMTEDSQQLQRRDSGAH